MTTSSYTLPEPEYVQFMPTQKFLYTAEQMHAAFKAGRESMREEAAKLCEEVHYVMPQQSLFGYCIRKIAL